MRPPIRLAILLCAFWTAFAGGTEAPFSFPAAQAQEVRRQGGGLLQFLFGRPERQPQVREAPRVLRERRQPQVREAPRRRRSSSPSSSSSSSSAPRSAPAVERVEKAEDAARVLVVGDFLAGGLADGLKAAYAENENIRIIDRTNGSSGLVRDDFYDWPAELPGLIEEEEPSAVVVMVGSNDRQQMRVDGGRAEPFSEAWVEEYENRAATIAEEVSSRNLPLIWVGTLPFRSDSMTRDMLSLNDIFQRTSEQVGGEFVDIWDGFVDENGNFVTHGPDINGQPTQLRSSDGINVTSSGRRKMAFYVEKPLTRLFGEGVGEAGVAGLGEFYGPVWDGLVPSEIERTMPISLTAPDLEDGSALLGATITSDPAEARTAGERLVHEGIAPPPRQGRADQFVGGAALPPEPEEPAAPAAAAEEGDEEKDRSSAITP